MVFAVIYKFHLRPGVEEEYQKLWRQVATYFVEKRGALGSCLHKTAEGEWIAYSRWPDKPTRDASWPKEGEAPSETLDPEIRAVILAIKDCMDADKPFQEICMEVVDDVGFKADSHEK
jgi:hypothetical protein